MLVSYHNHTKWSDGAPTVEEQIAAAQQVGLDELGISDHYVLTPDGVPNSWSLPWDRLGDYVAEILAAKERVARPIIRLGIEADYFPETVDTLRKRLAEYPFDYVIGSVHYVDDFSIDGGGKGWKALSEDERNEMWRRYWGRIVEMAESRVYDFAAHLDLPKKYANWPTVDLSVESGAALDALAAADMAIEINTAGWSMPAKEAYPSLSLLVEARRRNIPLLINADAHRAEYLTRDFDRARELAREAGYTELVRFDRHRRYPIPL